VSEMLVSAPAGVVTGAAVVAGAMVVTEAVVVAANQANSESRFLRDQPHICTPTSLLPRNVGE